MPSIVTRGSFSGKAFGLTGQTAAPVYVEDVFSTYLYTGNSAAQTITNNIDLSTKGGMVWTKFRSGSFGTENHALIDTVRGATKYVMSDATTAEQSNAGLTSFSTTGYLLGSDPSGKVNFSAQNYVGWTFRKQPKFFDVVTYTGNGVAGRQIAHALGATPGMILVKSTNVANNWAVWHKSLPDSSYFLLLNLTNAQASNNAYWNSTAPTSTVFTVGDKDATNQNGNTYVAYLFADQAGGFGLSSSDSVVACGGYTGTGVAGNSITLGWEPQYVLIKEITVGGASNWVVLDNMRGFNMSTDSVLLPNLANAESTTLDAVNPTAVGFQLISTGLNWNASGSNYIYLAIRRGPMKVPTSGTSVFTPNLTSVASGNNTVNVGFPPDHVWQKTTGSATEFYNSSRLIGSNYLDTTSTAAEAAGFFYWNNNTNFFGQGMTSSTRASYFFRRAPGYMDVVCYTGTGVARTVAHNLGVAPELIIVKGRSTVEQWYCYNATIGNQYFLYLNLTNGSVGPTTSLWNSTSPTSSVFSLGTAGAVNSSGATYVAYLFATCPGVSKVGSYTGTGAAQNINCGFSAGARFVLIKRTDSTGDWYVYDSARGISSGNDPYLLLNSTAAEVTGTNYVDTFSSGFTLTATAPAALNANGGSFIFLAIS